MRPLPLATLLLFGFTAWTTWRGFRHREWFERMMFRPDRILRDKEYGRLLSSALIHVDWVHFFCNGITIVAFGQTLEQGYGIGPMLAIYLGAVGGGSLLSLAIHRNHDYSAVGASGGACGLIFAHIFLFPGARVSLLILPIYVPGWLFALLFLLYSFSGMYRQKDNIGHDAHLGGALCGLAVATLLYPRIVLMSPLLLAAVVGVTAVFLVWFSRHPHSSLRTLFDSGVRDHRPSLRYQRYEENHQRAVMKDRLDALLDKVAERGLDRLTPRERAELDELSRKIRR